MKGGKKEMEKCFFIHPDNIEYVQASLDLKIAVIARPDWFMKKNKCEHLIVETPRGVHTRCYLAKSDNISFLIVYGRFDRIRSTSLDINYELTQEAISFLGIKKLVGTFVTGSIQEDDKAGNVYIPHDFIGLGGYNRSRNKEIGFRNVDMFKPFCEEMRKCLIEASNEVNFFVHTNGVYACFHGYPRIETEAELKFYGNIGCNIVGQTIDPEATLAREAGCHYVAIAATIDDYELRSRFMANDITAREEIDNNIVEGRKKTFNLFIRALPGLMEASNLQCNCEEQQNHVSKRSRHFYYRPSCLCD